MGEPLSRAVIVGAAPFEDAAFLASFLREDDAIFAADGGRNLVAAMGKSATMYIGDFDSSDLPQTDVPCVVLPVQKDDTDVLAAVRVALERGYKEFLILGGLGGRFDHSIANLFVLRFLLDHGACGALLDERHEVRLLPVGTHVVAPRENTALSLFPYGGEARGVTIRGAAYTVQDASFDMAFPIGVSNAFCEEPVEITVRDGCLLLILSENP